jgi:hypothetical protein
MYFYERKRKGQSLKSYADEARELEYRVSRTDDPSVKSLEYVAHAAKVRADARLLAGATHYVPGKKWNHKEVD